MQFLGVAVKDGLGAGIILRWIENGDSLDYIRNNPDTPRVAIVCSSNTGVNVYDLMLNICRFEAPLMA